MDNQDSTYVLFLMALKHLLAERFHGNKSALAREVCLSSGYITNILKGTKTAAYDSQVKIAESLGFGLFSFWKLGNSIKDNQPLQIEDSEMASSLVYIPKFQTRPPIGHSSGGYKGFYPFKREWVNEKGDIKNLGLMDVVGDSMTPILQNGDTIMLDISKIDLVPEQIYVVEVEDFTYLKYIDREPGKFILRSYNTNYPPIYIDSAYFGTESFQIIGRVVWWSHDVAV